MQEQYFIIIIFLDYFHQPVVHDRFVIIIIINNIFCTALVCSKRLQWCWQMDTTDYWAYMSDGNMSLKTLSVNSCM